MYRNCEVCTVTKGPADKVGLWQFQRFSTICKSKKKGIYIMKIAVTYSEGEIFQHFGHSEYFKVYSVKDNAIVDSEVIETKGQGHGALATLLASQAIDVLICGGIGVGAVAALEEAGIEVCSGVSGNADESVDEYLKGNLCSEGVNCEHHDEAHSCEDAEGSGCGSSCGSCGSCGSHKPAFDGPNVGRTVRAHYRGTFNDGTQFDSSYDRGEPLEFVCGAGMMIQGFDAAVATMKPGEKVTVHLMPKEAYGEKNPDAIFTIDFEELPGAEELEIGQRVYLQNQYGQPFPVCVLAKTDVNITFDANHEMAGKELNFEIELVEVQ